MDVDGDVIAVGADAHDVSGNSDRGKFYLFRYNSGTSSWDEEANYAPSSAANDYCGASVSVSGDRAVAGAWGDNTGYTDAGAAYVVEYDSGAGTWGSAVQITATDAGASDHFGRSVSIVGDRIIVGAPSWDDGGTSDVGGVYVYDYNSGTDSWDETGPLTTSDADAGDHFGESVALGDGRFFVGARYDDEFGSNAGAAYGFDLDGSWSQTAKVTAQLPTYAETPVVVIIDHRLRMYNPITGKWLTRDPIGYLAGSWNIYEYVRNSPWGYWDPWGTDELDDMLEKGPFRGGTRGLWGGDTEADTRIKNLVTVADGVGQAVGEAVTAPFDAVHAVVTHPIDTVSQVAFGGLERLGESLGMGINALQDGMSATEAAAVFVDTLITKDGMLDHILDLSEGVDRDGHVLTLHDKAYVATNLGIDVAKTVVDVVAAIGGIEALAESSVDDIATRLRNCSDLGCFTAGNTVLTAHGEVPIEDIRVGDRVLTTGDSDNADEIDVTDLQLVRLEMPTPDAAGDFLEIVLLRPQSWIEDASATDNEGIFIALPELGVEGPACVEAIEPCPPIEEGPGRIALMTVTHFNGYVMEIELEGSDTPIEPTRWHRLFSATDANWVPAAELNVGDELLTVDGAVRITSIRMKPDVYRVYNLEVDGDHEYFVGACGVLSHNSGATDPCRQLAEDLKFISRFTDDVSKLSLRGNSLGQGRKKLLDLGLKERISPRTGRHEFVDSEGRVRAAYDPKRQQGPRAGHWHKWGFDERGQRYPLRDSGRIVDSNSRGAHIPR